MLVNLSKMLPTDATHFQIKYSIMCVLHALRAYFDTQIYICPKERVCCVHLVGKQTEKAETLLATTMVGFKPWMRTACGLKKRHRRLELKGDVGYKDISVYLTSSGSKNLLNTPRIVCHKQASYIIITTTEKYSTM